MYIAWHSAIPTHANHIDNNEDSNDGDDDDGDNDSVSVFRVWLQFPFFWGHALLYISLHIVSLSYRRENRSML
jgi:hypothetical protein